MQAYARILIGGVTLATALLAPAPSASGQQLTVERIFGSSDFRTQSLPELQWMDDGQRYTFVEADSATDVTDLWVEDARTGERTRIVEGSRLIPPGASEPIPIEGYQWSPDEQKLLIYTNSQRVWRQNTKGTYYVYDLADGTLTPVSTRPGWQQFAKFSPDGTRVGFVRENNLFVTDLATGAETQLTFDGSENIINGTFDWVYEEELDLQDGWRWSPDGERIAFWQLDQSPIDTFYMIDYSETYTDPIPLRYPKAGEENSRVRIGVIELDGGEITWMDTGPERDIYLARMDWAASPGELMIQRMNRHQNRVDVLLADAETGATRTLFTETDSAWVDVDYDLAWIRGGEQFLWSSERDGFNHLYLYNRDGSLARQLTDGPWVVSALHGVDEENGWVYFSSTEEGPLERQLYRAPLDGEGAIEQISTEPGTHRVRLSPEYDFYIDVFSTAASPPTTRLHEDDGTPVRVLADNAEVAAELNEFDINPIEFFTVEAADGETRLNAWMIRPPDFDPARQYPVLMYVYGGPGSQTVTDSWGGSRYLWHQLLAQEGVIVVSVDNRGTGGRGRDFKKVTYLKLGELESADQIAAARHLATLPYVDDDRIGIWGWSYGGYMTALAMMHGGNLFDAGISVAPVTDWHLYDTIYTERFMRTPRENPEGYRESAPLNHAADLEGELLLVHGTGDDNVHFQNSVQLADALQAAGKQFDFMPYPGRTHSISGGNTSVHLFTMLTEWITEAL